MGHVPRVIAQIYECVMYQPARAHTATKLVLGERRTNSIYLHPKARSTQARLQKPASQHICDHTTRVQDSFHERPGYRCVRPWGAGAWPLSAKDIARKYCLSLSVCQEAPGPAVGHSGGRVSFQLSVAVAVKPCTLQNIALQRTRQSTTISRLPG